MKARIAVFAAGVVGRHDERLTESLRDLTWSVAADGGLAHARDLGVRIDVLVGDLDSADPGHVAEAEQNGARVERHPAAKDETDLELALLSACEQAPTEAVLIGLLGGRIDHELANLGLVAQRRWFDAGLHFRIEDGDRTVHIVHDELTLGEPAGTTISVLPWLGSATGVLERGMEWDLTDATLAAGTSQGMSNVAVAETQLISVETGVLLVIVDRSD